jgi:hypothetical protein
MISFQFLFFSINYTRKGDAKLQSNFSGEV